MALNYYPGGFLNITGQQNKNENEQSLVNIMSLKNYMDTSNANIAEASDLAKNHPATIFGIDVGIPVGTWVGWRAGQAFQKYLEGKPKLDFKVQPINYTNSATGEKFSRSDVQKMLANGKASIRTENIPNYNFFGNTPQPNLNLQNPNYQTQPVYRPDNWDNNLFGTGYTLNDWKQKYPNLKFLPKTDREEIYPEVNRAFPLGG